MITDVISIEKKMDAPGYIYFVRFEYFKNCYKIGSTANLYARLKTLRGTYGNLELIAYGYSNNKQQTEIIIQNLLHQFSNYNITSNLLKLKGMHSDIISRICHCNALSCEFFIFCKFVVYDVICLLDTLCQSIQIGSDNTDYKWDRLPSYWEPTWKPNGWVDFNGGET